VKRRITELMATGILAGGCTTDAAFPPGAQQARDHFTEAALRAHMRYLSDDLLEGRGTGTRGQELAAKYVAEEFEAAGLEPAGVNGTFVQPVPFRQITVDATKCELSITRDGRSSALKWGEDFIMGGAPLSPDASVDAVDFRCTCFVPAPGLLSELSESRVSRFRNI
jgi:hypothetical protein